MIKFISNYNMVTAKYLNRSIMKSLSYKLKKLLFYPDTFITTPYHDKIKVLFADDIATGRPSFIIDKMIERYVIPFYSNVHSNAAMGQVMAKKIEMTRKLIKEYYNLNDNYKVIFTGSGATAATNHLIHVLDYKKHTKIDLFISLYEHYSNHLPWVELQKIENINLNIVPLDSNDEINYNYIDEKINMLDKSTLKIISITACSNVNGIITNIEKLKIIKMKYNNVLLLLDCACIAPYKRFSAIGIDALYISGHKFLGGPSSPGILLIDEKLFEKKEPYCPGGGCVEKVTSKEIIYHHDIEKRESGGTPNIISICRLYYVYKLYLKLIGLIEYNEQFLTKYINKKLNEFITKYNNFKVLMLNSNINNKLPIISFSIKGFHYNYVVVLLNDLFGIQSRGGISCCGLLAEYIENRYGIQGWTRISFSWRMSKEEVDLILNAIEFIIINGERYKKKYKYDAHDNRFFYKN